MNINEETWDDLATMLRSEIEGYGRLFCLLETQREQLMENNLEGLLSINDALNAHTNVLQTMRRERESRVLCLSQDTPDPAKTPSLKKLLGRVPDEARALFEELLAEINRLVRQSRQKLQQNQMLLRRCRDIGHSFLCLINPDEAQKSKVYTPDGRYQASGMRSSAPRSYQTHA